MFTLENEARKTLAQILAGVFLLGGLYSTVRTLQISEEAQLTGRLERATEQLGSEKQHVRVSGIHTLTRLTKESGKFKPIVYDIFQSFIKTASRDEDRAQEEVVEVKPNPSSNINSNLSIGTTNRKKTYQYEIQIIIKFLINEAYPVEGQRIDLSNSYLNEIIFSRGICNRWDFSDADLDRAKFHSSRLMATDFIKASLREVEFNSAILSGANFDSADLSGANFKNADLSDANLSGAHFLIRKKMGKLQRSNFIGSKFR